MTVVLAGFLLGLAGSGHCVLMCGPILALTTTVHAARSIQWTRAALHHTGRLLVYGAIGAVVGGFGHAVTLVGLGRGLAVAAGAVLVGTAFGAGRPAAMSTAFDRAVGVLMRGVRSVADWMRIHRIRGPLATGALNALLPCGLVYGAAAAAIGLGHTRESLAFMLAFGVGTLPVTMALSVSSGVIAAVTGSRRRLRWLAPAALALTGLLLIARGMTPAADSSGNPGGHTHAGHAATP